ncbi:MAG TPA: hypothetical protein ENH67_04495 [Pseudoalteromonas sp.]|nr:hypothetical protein [Pseudoalteromonas sp.]
MLLTRFSGQLLITLKRLKCLNILNLGRHGFIQLISKSKCCGIVILATIYIQTCIKPSGAFLCLSFIKNVH